MHLPHFPTKGGARSRRAERTQVEYRAAMGLDLDGQQEPTPAALGAFPAERVLYDATIP